VSSELQQRTTHAELSKEPVVVPDPHDEPSVEWGWHGTLPNGALIGGIAVTLILFGMFIGNQTGHVELYYLGLTGVVMLLLVARSVRRRRRSAWRP
jgi:hypothetical protein